MKRKNVVFIVTDSLRKDYLQPYNREIDFTENISRFAEESITFEDAVASASWTLPSHATFFSGLYPWVHGATQRNLDLNVDRKLLAECFREKGYRTACFSTNAWLSNRFGLTEGFQKVENFGSSGLSGKLSKIRRELDDWLSSPGLERIKKPLVRSGNYLFHYWLGGSNTEEIIKRSEIFIQNGDQPFFLFMNLMDAHEPYFPPKEYRKKHEAPHPRSVCQNPTDFYSGREVDFESISRIYSASVDYMDDQIGRLFDFLRKNNYWNNTIVLLISDHGQMLGEEEHYGHQYSVSEELVSVPMIMKKGKKEKIGRQVELREIYNLLPEAAGINEKKHELGTKYALGSYEFPDLQRPRIPESRWNDLYKRHKFSRNDKGKVIETESEEGETEIYTESFGGENQISLDVKKDLEKELKNVRTSNKGKNLEEKEEEIQKRLKDLGYG